MSCFSCGIGFNSSVNDKLRLFKEDYLNNGTIRYFYKTNKYSEVLICKQNSFTYIYETIIKPNLKNGAEYSSIAEYT